jgi:hypothetical protein
MLLAEPVHAAPRAGSTAPTAMVLKSEDEAMLLTDRVMKAVARGELDAVYGALKNYAVLPAAGIDAGLQSSKQQRAAPAFAERFGATLGYEFIDKKKIGQSMLRVRYIEKTEKQPLPWTFHFYLTPHGWVLSEFGWDAHAAALYDAD